MFEGNKLGWQEWKITYEGTYICIHTKADCR